MLRAYTLNIDDALMKAAKQRALDDGTSVSEVVRRLLSDHLGVQWKESAMQPPDEIMKSLARYSAGAIRRNEAMRAIGLDVADLGRFNALMAEFDISWPALDMVRIEQQAAVVTELISAVREARQ
jgi:hypothetical protein